MYRTFACVNINVFEERILVSKVVQNLGGPKSDPRPLIISAASRSSAAAVFDSERLQNRLQRLDGPLCGVDASTRALFHFQQGAFIAQTGLVFLGLGPSAPAFANYW